MEVTCCKDPSCSHAVVAAATREAQRLSARERDAILKVLQRNELLHRDQQKSIMRLKAELQNLRRKGAIKASTDFDSTGPDPDRSCGRCRVELGRVINRGAYCRACRLKVCKSCREYSFRTTDWVCTVCYKHMEIQAASGEWMNEFVRRPSRRRDNRVYVPAADLIKRTIRRSWTISNPTPRWNAFRDSPEMRPYNSLPRGQDINNFPSLAVHQKGNRSPSPIRVGTISPIRKRSPARRSHSEDIYNDRTTEESPKSKDKNMPDTKEEIKQVEEPKIDPVTKRSIRVNPLIKYASETKQCSCCNKSEDSNKEEHIAPENASELKRKSMKSKVGDVLENHSTKKMGIEKRVSFGSGDNKEAGQDGVGKGKVKKRDILKQSHSVIENTARNPNIYKACNSEDCGEESLNPELNFAKEEAGSVELCDIEPLSGTVFRKVTVRRRRQEMKKLQAVDTGWRKSADGDLLDILMPEGDDYKLVFLSSDSSSKEEDLDDNDSSSTASSFPVEDCDWDYFEPGSNGSKPIRWNSPFGSPRVYRKSFTESPIGSPLVFRKLRESDDEMNSRLDSGSPASSDSLNFGEKGMDEHKCVHKEEALPQKMFCHNCGASSTQYVPIPVPVPIPIPIQTIWGSGELKCGTDWVDQAFKNKFRALPRSMWPFLNQAALFWPLLTVPNELSQNSLGGSENVAVEAAGTQTDEISEVPVEDLGEKSGKYNAESGAIDGHLVSENSGIFSSDSSDSENDAVEEVKRVYNVSGLASTRESDDALPSSEVSDEDVSQNKDSHSESPSSGSDTDTDDTGTVRDQNSQKRFSKVFVVNSRSNSESSESNEEEEVILTGVKLIDGDKQSEFSLESSEPGGAGGDSRCATGESIDSCARNAAKYTSLVMITQESQAGNNGQVSVVTTETTQLVDESEIVVRHTLKDGENLSNYFTLTLDSNLGQNHSPKRPKITKNEEVPLEFDEKQTVAEEDVTVVTGGNTLSAVVCLEEGLADDDSWVENLSHDEDDFPPTSPEDSSSGEEITLTCSSALDNEDELRGYHRTAIDFTLHTIVEESCEESEVESLTSKVKKQRPTSVTDLEKYFFFGLGDGNAPSLGSNREDAYSETSSIYSEGVDNEEPPQNSPTEADPAELASSRLEKYFLSGFMGFRRDSDGSVGSDSEGHPSPEQRRKRLVRARGTGRSHSSSLDNLLASPELNQDPSKPNEHDSEDSDTDTYEETNFEKIDGQFDTVKRKKCGGKSSKKQEDIDKKLELTEEEDLQEDGRNTPTQNSEGEKKQDLADSRSRDSGFVGSQDDLLKDANSFWKKPDLTAKTPPATSLTRKDSFNNWSSDEETNLMMSKMRQFFKTMVANTQVKPPSSSPITKIPASPKLEKSKTKPPQLVYFENELTRLMKTVPGIRDEQVREIVEYLSSEDTWSDSYDSSDYTSSDLEGACVQKSVLQQQISESCKEIINKFENSGEDPAEDVNQGLNKETAFVYQKLVASFEKMAVGEEANPHSSPPLIAKVMHHIGSRLVALMHEVSSGESSPKVRHYHRRLQQKLSNASTTTTEDDDSTSDSNLQDKLSALESVTPYLLPRSKSHDLLVGEHRNHLQSSGATSDVVEEREASDCERFSWRGSFESALLASDSRTKLSLLSGESSSSSALALAAKRRSAGDLLFCHKSLSREQLDRVRSCGSIGGATSEDKLWVSSASRPSRRRSSVPDASCGSGGSADGEDDDDEELESRSTLPRSLQTSTATTNSLPRLPTNNQGNSSMQKAHSMYHFLQQNVKSARYRPPGFNRLAATAPKRAVSAPGLQPSHQRRGRRSQQSIVPSDDVSLSEAHSSPMLASRSSKSATPSPVAPSSRRGTSSSQDWQSDDNDIDRLVTLHNRSSLSSLGLRSDSMASVYSGAGEGRYGTVAVKGQVEFGLQYNYKASALEIMIKQCKDLAPVDTKRNRSDPYVKVYLLPDKSKSGKRKTKVRKHTLNPVFDECLKFHISLNELETRTLWLTVWHSDMFGRNDFLGEVMMALENKVFDDPTPKLYNLQERTEPFEDMLSFKGDILVGLKFVPPDMTVIKKGKRSRGALHVLVKEAKALTAVKANGTSDPFCKSYLLPDKGRSSKQKTSVVKRSINPVWNHTFIYEDVTLQELAERCLELTVWDHDRLASNEFLGGVRFSLGTGKHYGKPVDWMDAKGKELSLWKSMLERPNFWVEGCLSLRPT